MLKKVMYIIAVVDMLLKAVGLLLSMTVGAGTAFPELLYILCGVWMIVALLFLVFEKGERRHVSHMMYFFIFDFAYTAFSLVYTGWIKIFDVMWYHYLIIGTLFTLLVDLVIVLSAIRHTSYKKYIEIPKETLKNAEQQEETN